MWQLIYSKIFSVTDPFPQVSANSDTTTAILDFIFGVFGAVAVLMIIIGGFRYIVSSGEPKATSEARDTIIYAAVGLAIVIFAYTIVSFVLGKF